MGPTDTESRNLFCEFIDESMLLSTDFSLPMLAADPPVDAASNGRGTNWLSQQSMLDTPAVQIINSPGETNQASGEDDDELTVVSSNIPQYNPTFIDLTLDDDTDSSETAATPIDPVALPRSREDVQEEPRLSRSSSHRDDDLEIVSIRFFSKPSERQQLSSLMAGTSSFTLHPHSNIMQFSDIRNPPFSLGVLSAPLPSSSQLSYNQWQIPPQPSLQIPKLPHSLSTTAPVIRTPSPENPAVFKCSVCLEKASETTNLCSTVCGHIFCEDCIRGASMRQKSCPICRKKLGKNGYHRLFLS
ncbi:uncharacterized protein BJ171DRAFT_237031 [Polychytrium aggregatum]|uniref:uncharacterized protein n=1 Tax=Polychytrium aggregatum TaxID=110093 RepID=UPI0022FDFA49|nr:uncharacterized protein BJ171DRAFT_237031 [Polychytrium aggregatum]KAI9208251.1 hypothetical protein BJ171DRAFT_237031 [Polychytrium aggregatum]